MRLRTTILSPFGRKVRMAVLRLGLQDQITIADTNFLDPADPLRVENPLGKMPVLTTDDGEHLYDSRVILEYLDDYAGGGRIIPRTSMTRFATLRLQALCDGVMDAGVSIVLEGRLRPPEKQHAGWIDYQREKMDRGLTSLAASQIDPRAFDVGTVALACTLGFIDRRGQTDWRGPFPQLEAWLEQFARATPEFAATEAPKA